MARLFITPREIDLISDLTKEITKDVIGDKIYYYEVREDATQINEIYDEAQEKVYNPPVEIDARVQWNPREVKSDRFGTHATYTTEVYIHYRDIIDRGISVTEGDFFTHGDNVFEVTSTQFDKTIFGQVEHLVGLIVKAKQARKGTIDLKIWGPTDRVYTDADAVRDTFKQQRGDATMGDSRTLVDQGKVDNKLHVQQEVKRDDTSSSFYGDEP